MKRLLLLFPILFLLSCLSWGVNCVDTPLTTSGLQCSKAAQLPAGINANYTGTVINTTFPVQGSAGQCDAANQTQLARCIANALTNCGVTGYVITVHHGVDYIAPSSWVLRANNCGTNQWAVIQVDDLALLPQGKKVGAADVAKLATFHNADVGYPVLITPDDPANPPQRWWLAGIEFASTTTTSEQFAIVMFGDRCGTIGGGGCGVVPFTSRNNYANKMVLDRSYVHSAGITGNVRHGVRFTAGTMAIIDTTIDEVHTTNCPSGCPDSTGISSDDSFGPVKIQDNDIADVGENIIFGGGDPPINGQVTCDIEVRNNLIRKKSAWTVPFPSNMKDVFELKNGCRALLIGNYFKDSYTNGTYASMVLTPRNPGGGCTWCTINDVTEVFNIHDGFGDMYSILGANGNNGSGGSLGPELPAQRITIMHNLYFNWNPGVYGGNGRWMQLSPGGNDTVNCSAMSPSDNCILNFIWITNNTVLNGANAVLTFAGSILPASKIKNLTYKDNVIGAGSGFITADTGTVHPLYGSGSVFDYYTDTATLKFDTNAFVNIGLSGYGCGDLPSPIRNFCGGIGPPATFAALGFANYQANGTGNYEMCAAAGVPLSTCSAISTYYAQGSNHLSPGADPYAVNQATYGVLTGIYGTPPSILAGPYQSADQLDLQTKVLYPGYYGLAVGDGSGKADYSGFNSGNAISVRAGIDQFFDLRRDMLKEHNIGGFDSGISSKDLYTSGGGSLPCGFGSGVTDQKGFWGQVIVDTTNQNDVERTIKWRWPLVKDLGDHLPPVVPPQVFVNQIFTFKRPGIVVENTVWDNNCGGTINLQYQYNQNNWWDNFNGHAQSASSPYPPYYGVGWYESVYQGGNLCVPGGSGYTPCLGPPWGWGGGTITGINFHSTGLNDPGQNSYTPTPGSVPQFNSANPGGSPPYTSNQLYQIGADFLMMAKEQANTGYWPYQLSNAPGVRSKFENSISVPSSGNNSAQTHNIQWAGDNNVKTLSNVTSLRTPYLAPPGISMSSGTGGTMNYDFFDYVMVADATPKVDFTFQGADPGCPTFRISGWGGAAIPPTIQVGANVVSQGFGYVADYVNSGDHNTLLVQLVNPPSQYNANTSPAFCPAIINGTRVVISSSGGVTAPGNIGGGTISGGITGR